MWCQNDKNDFMSNINGQISPHNKVGQTLIQYVQSNTLRNIVDIGTWNGMGSTRCFLLGLQNNSETEFYTLETNKDKHLIAQTNLSKLITSKTKFLWGSILKSSDITNIFTIFPELLFNKEFKRWHNLDIQNINCSPYILSELPSEIDFILFDGGEFTTYYEFQLLFPRCKKFIALDDTNVSKCKKIREILRNHSEWKEIETIKERNGFSLFQHI